MSNQPFQQRPAGGPDDAAEAAQVTATPAAQTGDIDAMLDEIDGVLETNATEFVSGFVQKGGE